MHSKDFTPVAYKCLRLPFGLRPSPFLLTLVLYRLLILDQHCDSKVNKLKHEVYNNIYVDNGCVTSNHKSELEWKYKTVHEVFSEYKFDLQQFATNESQLQSNIDSAGSTVTSQAMQVLGHTWDRSSDSLSPSKIVLVGKANTLRKCLSSVNSVYDLLGVYCPVLLRARLLVQSLQCNSELNWDTEISSSLQKEWVNIAKQANQTPVISIPRSVGSRSSSYNLIVYTDASNSACGCVLYIMDMSTNSLSFCGASSKLLSDNLKKKSIPSLELLGIVWGLQYMLDRYDSIASSAVVQPIAISSLFLFTDSTCCLH